MDEALTVAAPAHRSRTTRGTGRPTSSPRTAGSSTCARSARRRRRDPGLARPALRAHPLPALLRPVPADLRAGPGPVHRRRPPRPGGTGRRCSATRSSRSAATRQARPGRHRGEGRPRSRSSSRTPTRAAGSARSCWSTSPPRPASAGSAGSSPRCWPRTARWCGSSATPATRSAASTPTGVVHLTSPSTRPSARWRSATRASSAPRPARRPAAHPRSIAVIGACTDPTKIGHAVLRNLLRGNFAGPGLPGQPGRPLVRGVRAYPPVIDIPDDVDLAVVAVPAARSPRSSTPAAPRGCTALVVITAGFADAGPDGATAQRQLVAAARAHGMRVVGPNCLGMVNTDPQVRLNATLAPMMPAPRPGRLLLPVRGAGHRPARRRRRSGGWACRPSSRPATAPTCRATTCCSTGRPTRPPRSCCCTWRRSATRASSPGWPAGSPGPSRSWR